mmetsp:Transcript_107296/g.313742  ORF Transcript_107296/g.313742 Transcript_107296/m.313742 type:complete len:246 (+) Transcript_107296:86-823(+)
MWLALPASVTTETSIEPLLAAGLKPAQLWLSRRGAAKGTPARCRRSCWRQNSVNSSSDRELTAVMSCLRKAWNTSPCCGGMVPSRPASSSAVFRTCDSQSLARSAACRSMQLRASSRSSSGSSRTTATTGLGNCAVPVQASLAAFRRRRSCQGLRPAHRRRPPATATSRPTRQMASEIGMALDASARRGPTDPQMRNSSGVRRAKTSQGESKQETELCMERLPGKAWPAGPIAGAVAQPPPGRTL